MKKKGPLFAIGGGSRGVVVEDFAPGSWSARLTGRFESSALSGGNLLDGLQVLSQSCFWNLLGVPLNSDYPGVNVKRGSETTSENDL